MTIQGPELPEKPAGGSNEPGDLSPPQGELPPEKAGLPPRDFSYSNIIGTSRSNTIRKLKIYNPLLYHNLEIVSNCNTPAI